jgi:hypothetical protein
MEALAVVDLNARLVSLTICHELVLVSARGSLGLNDARLSQLRSGRRWKRSGFRVRVTGPLPSGPPEAGEFGKIVRLLR